MRILLGSLSLLILTLLVPVTGTTSSNPSQNECPTISIETPAQVICPDARVTFTARITDGVMNGQPTFNWTVSAGRIIKGQGTPTITVATTGVEGTGGLTATVELLGLRTSCPITSTYGVSVSAFCPERKFDEYSGNLSFEEEKGRLGLFAAQLRSTPDTMGLITIRPDGKMEAGEREARRERARRYLVEELGLDPERVSTEEGDGLEELTVELWIMPTKLPPDIFNHTLNSGPAESNPNTPKPAAVP